MKKNTKKKTKQKKRNHRYLLHWIVIYVQNTEKNRFSQTLRSDQGNLFNTLHIRSFVRSFSQHVFAFWGRCCCRTQISTKNNNIFVCMLLWFGIDEISSCFIPLIFFIEIIAHFTKHRNLMMSHNEWESKWDGAAEEVREKATEIDPIENRATFWRTQTKMLSVRFIFVKCFLALFVHIFLMLTHKSVYTNEQTCYILIFITNTE